MAVDTMAGQGQVASLNRVLPYLRDGFRQVTYQPEHALFRGGNGILQPLD